jgi:hypothetical protein
MRRIRQWTTCHLGPWCLTQFPVRQECCAAWATAHVGGSDFDEYFFALVRYRPLEGPGKPMIGSNLPPVARCPWCGAIKAAKRPE